MLKSQRMVKVLLAGPKPYLKSITNKLYDLNFFHVIEHSRKEGDDIFDIGSPFEENEKNADLLVKVRTLKAFLGIKGSGGKVVTKLDLEQISKTTDTIFDRTKDLQKALRYYEKILKVHESNEQIKALETLLLPKTEGVDYKSMNCFIGFIREDVEQDVTAITSKYEIFTNKYKDLDIIALFTEKSKKKEMQKILELHLFSPIENPFIKTQFGDLESEIGIDFVKLGKELERVTQKKVELLSEVSSIKKEYEQFLKDADKVLGENVTVAEAPLMFATSKNIFVVRGWAPEDKIGELKKELNSIAKDKIYVHTEKPDKHDNVPIAFQNPKLVEPFEFFMNLYTLPSYKEIDPTFFLALTFPIFFGMMLGDVGYGLITLALFWYLKVKMPKAKVLNAFMIASVSTIIFGVIFGEYFGLEVFPSSMNGIGRVVCDGYHLCERTIEDGKVIYEIPHLLTRHKQIGDLLSISLLIGVFHLALGLIIGFINVYEAHGFKMAIFEKGGWIMILPFMVWLLTDQLNIITGFSADLIRPFFPAPAIIIGIFVLGGIFVVIGEGVRGAIEVLFMSMLSNILSYGRLMAVGLASVGLAAVVNQLAGQMFQGGILGIIMGVLVLVMGHTINILLGILSPFLHAIRLHYVEFFGKFYHGGGVQFKSFGRKD